MPLWDRLKNKPRRADGPGGNVVLASATGAAPRLDAIAQQIGAVGANQYVIFANHDDVDEYVQFARKPDGSYVMEVASGEYTAAGPNQLSRSHLAVTTLASLGLHAAPGENFMADGIVATPSQMANWVEGIFLNLFRLDDSFTLDVLGDPARAETTSAV